MEIQHWLNTICVLAVIILLQYFRKKQREVNEICDFHDISANDYTIMISNIPKDYKAINDDYDDDIKDFIQNHIISDKTVNIREFYYFYWRRWRRARGRLGIIDLFPLFATI